VTLGADVTVGKIRNTADNAAKDITIAGDASGLYKITLDPTADQITIQGKQGLTPPFIIAAPIALLGNTNEFRDHLTISGAISGASLLRYYGGVTTVSLTLTASNTFSGGFYLSPASAVVIGHNNALGTGAFTANGNGSTYYLSATNGDRTITNNFASQNWDQKWVFRGKDDMTFTGAFKAMNYEAGKTTSVDVVDADGVVTFRNFTLQSSGASVGAGFKKFGAGTLVLDGAFTPATGAMPVGISNGTFLVNTTVTNLGNVVVDSGATLGGTGTIYLAATKTCTVAQAAAVAPGVTTGATDIATLTVNGAFDFQSNAVYHWQGNATTGDLVRVNGTLTLPAVATVNVNGSMPTPSILFAATTLAGPGATDVSGWVVNGAAGVKIVGTTVQLQTPPAGTLITIR
jgi:hypothetical protein